MDTQKVRIVVTDPLIERMPEISQERYPEEDKRIEWVMAESGDEEELCGLVPGAEILVGGRYSISAKVLAKADKVHFHQQCSQGYDNIDLNAAKEKGITVSHCGIAGTIPVAEHALMLMLAVAKSLPRCHATMANGEWAFPEMLSRVYELYDKTLGIVGLGKIGMQTAMVVQGLNMRVQYYDPYPKDLSHLPFSMKSVSLEELLKTSDFVSIHAPLTDATHHMIGREELRMMKPSAYLINTGRGCVVDENALADALEQRWIAGAGLDVFGGHHEPPPKNAKILELPNVVLTPHIGGATAEDIYRNFYEASLDNIMLVLNGKKPQYVVSEGRMGS